MNRYEELIRKDSLLVIGLMSGTSADGLDAALTRIDGSGTGMSVRQLAFVSMPYPEKLRTAILRLASGEAGGSRELCLFHFLLGRLSLEACLAVCEKAGVKPADIDLVGSHGQTLYHIPQEEDYLGWPVSGTLQLGEASVISEGLGCPAVSDFRVRDMAAGGQGAPLVPYAEYLIYRKKDRNRGLQNIGGIGNITVLPADCALEDVFAFDTGPGNMVMDQLTEIFTKGRLHYDRGGELARKGAVSASLLARMMEDPYLTLRPPKTTGREMYGKEYVEKLLSLGTELGLSGEDMIATAARFTAECIRVAIEDHCRVRPEELIVGGGGSSNPYLMEQIRGCLSVPVLTNEDLGLSSDAKEAVAFAVLASECIHGHVNNVPSVTGARHPVVMGKISW